MRIIPPASDASLLAPSGSIAKLAKPFTTKGTLRLRSGQAPAHEGETRTLNPSGSSVGEESGHVKREGQISSSFRAGQNALCGGHDCLDPGASIFFSARPSEERRRAHRLGEGYDRSNPRRHT